jgi:hypothetical protein
VPEEEVRIAEIKAFNTKNGHTRYVLVDDRGKEYSTFKEQIAAKLPGLEGKKVRITYEAADREISPRDLFAKLQPFKKLVAEDIEQNGDGSGFWA